MTGAVSVDIQIASAVASVPGEEQIESWISAVIERAAGDDAVEVSVRIVDEDEGRNLNNEFRGKDQATNVLSFPSGVLEPLADDLPRPLGDIVICGPVVEREAEDQGKANTDHWAHLLVHGTLHLLGYDHESGQQADAMESIEKEILATRGITDPYAA